MRLLWVVPRYGGDRSSGRRETRFGALVLDTCSWSAVRERFRAVVERLAA